MSSASIRFTSMPETELAPIIDRVMRTWSLITLLPEHQLLAARSSVSALLRKNPELSESEMLVMGYRHLHQIWDKSRAVTLGDKR
jgi:hypothetical protein